MPTSLTADETAARFGVSKAIAHFPSNLSPQEEKNVRLVLEYMEIAYSPTENKGASSVAHLCAPRNTFLAPSTFPTAHTAEEYSEAHAHVMSALRDLHIIQFDVVVAKENFVSLRYTATGSHIGAAHNGIPPTRRKAQWTAAGNFIIDEETGLIQHWWKDWDKMQMWKQLGWVLPDNDKVEFA
ncbi:NTF2-like protein [Dentipellis sp. KUC8613]|nr:NTF2-like protein [Dentipellis sp. KUC8613]